MCSRNLVSDTQLLKTLLEACLDYFCFVYNMPELKCYPLPAPQLFASYRHSPSFAETCALRQCVYSELFLTLVTRVADLKKGLLQ